MGKFFGAAIAARLTGFDWRASAVIGTLMNTRGLTELIVLNLALEKGVISDALFAALVLMALVTTFMAGPLLRLFDPKNSFGAPLEEELEDARELSRAEFPELAVPERSILVAPQGEDELAGLLAIAEPLARSEPPRELILARLVRPTPRRVGAGGAADRADAAAAGARRGHDRPARAGRARHRRPRGRVQLGRPRRGPGPARRERGGGPAARSTAASRCWATPSRAATSAPCCATPCATWRYSWRRERQPVAPGPDRPVLVPFGGAEHDWAALELGAWLASATDAPLKMLGAAGSSDEHTRVTRMLGDAGLLVQQYAGIPAEPLVAEPGGEGILQAAEGAGLLVIGLSERWRKEGLGPTRAEIARNAPAPAMFVRRGTRPGALAPREDVTRFTWSRAGQGMAPTS